MARLGRSDDREPVRIDDEITRQFRAMGAEVPAQETCSDKDAGGFEVLPSNWKSVCAFLACETQWRVVTSMAGLIWLGLDYQGVDVVLRRSSADEAVFADIQIMESEALVVFGEAQS